MIGHIFDGDTIMSLLRSLPVPLVIALSLVSAAIVAGAVAVSVKACRNIK